jgi:hypothetical protein
MIEKAMNVMLITRMSIVKIFPISVMAHRPLVLRRGWERNSPGGKQLGRQRRRDASARPEKLQDQSTTAV